MRRTRLLWHVFPAFLVIAVLSVAGLTWYATGFVRRVYLEQRTADLESTALLVERQFSGLLAGTGHAPAIEPLCRDLGRQGKIRITVILPDGRVLCDSSNDPATMEGHADRFEVREALAGRRGRAVRRSATLGVDMLYVAVPLLHGPDTAGAVRLAIPMTTLDEALKHIRRTIAAGGLVVVLLAALVSFYLSRRIVRPLEDLRDGAQRFARGDLRTPLPVPQVEEIATLAEAMNRMAADLDERIGTVISQRNTLEGVLSSMVEGVFAVDTQDRIIIINRSAASLLGLGADEARGRTVQEMIRNADIQKFLDRSRSSDGPIEAEILLYGAEERFVQTHGTLLQDARGKGIGVLVVMNDVTRLRRLEGVRRDFVANASHEMRTPITSIKGFVETLLDGALDDRPTLGRFLEIIGKEADRLSWLVEDLLSLASIEQQAEHGGVFLEEGNLGPVIAEAVEACQPGAERRKVTIEVQVGPGLRARVNPSLLTQAFINLIDNAVKYSHEGGRVLVVGSCEPGKVAFSVRDWGPGIPREHLPRLFERFYRVDKGRSRDRGGTGLGLSIVRHIAQAHGGAVEVDSTVGQGSTFTIRLPAPAASPASSATP